MKLPVMNRPCAVVEAKSVLVVALSVPNEPASDVSVFEKNDVDVAFTNVMFANELTPMNVLFGPTITTCPVASL